MGWFSKQTELERQLEIYGEQMEVTQAELEELDGVETPQSEIRREELTEQAANIELAQEQIKEAIRQEVEQEQQQDYFND